MRTIHLYRFRHFDPLRQRWTLARYVCEPPEIRCRYCDYELVGAPEIRQVPDNWRLADASKLARGAAQR